MTRRNRSAVDILEDHERAIKRLQAALSRAGGGVSGAAGYRETVVFTSSGTFTKADYPWLTHVRITVVGGGGAGGGTPATGVSEWCAVGGGGAGATSISDKQVADLAAAETVTVGLGGTGAYGGNGAPGGDSSFGALVVAKAGLGGPTAIVAATNAYTSRQGALGGAASAGTGDIKMDGGAGWSGIGESQYNGGHDGGNGGASTLSGAAQGGKQDNGDHGLIYGGGGGGSAQYSSQGTRKGGDGAEGVVIVELFDKSGTGSPPFDHGTDLVGQGDDDHPQYALANGTRDITGKQTFSYGIWGAEFQAGDDLSASGGDVQLSFGFGGTGTYRHAIKTRHNSAGGANNAFDFYLWNSATDALGALGSYKAFTIDSVLTEFFQQTKITKDDGLPQMVLEGGTTGFYWAGLLQLERNEDNRQWSIGMRGALDTGHEADLLIEEFDGSAYSPWLRFIIGTSRIEWAPGGTVKPMALTSAGSLEIHGISNEIRFYARDNDDGVSLLYNPNGDALHTYVGRDLLIAQSTQTGGVVRVNGQSLPTNSAGSGKAALYLSAESNGRLETVGGLLFGVVNTTTGGGWIQAADPGGTFNNLYLQPQAGAVSIVGAAFNYTLNVNGYLQTTLPTTGAAANVHAALISGADYLYYRFTSARKYKKHISYKTGWLADIELKPATFWRDDDDEWSIGFIADDLADEDYRLGLFEQPDKDDPEIEVHKMGEEAPTPRTQLFDSHKPWEVDNFQDRGVLAVLAAKANRSDERWAEQEARLQSLEDALRKLEKRGGVGRPE